MDTARALVAFSLILIAMLAHAGLAQYFGWGKQWPIPELVVMAAAVIVLMRQWMRSRPVKKGLIVLNVTAWALVGFFLWWTQVYSGYAKMEDPTTTGADVMPRLSIEGLVDESNTPIDLDTVLAESDATLFVFYRGYW